MTALYLFRHGETEWSRSGQHTGRTDLPLTPTGGAARRRRRPHARPMLREDPPLVAVEPAGTRALRTAELAGLSVSDVTEDLAEWDYGEYEGLSTPEIRETVPGWTVWTHPCPGGETAEQVGARAAQVLERVRDALAGRRRGPGGARALQPRAGRDLARPRRRPPASTSHSTPRRSRCSATSAACRRSRRLNVPPLPERGFHDDVIRVRRVRESDVDAVVGAGARARRARARAATSAT